MPINIPDDVFLSEARLRERLIAEAVLRGDEKYIEQYYIDNIKWGGTIEWDLTTKWWQFRRRRKMLRLALAEMEKEQP